MNSDSIAKCENLSVDACFTSHHNTGALELVNSGSIAKLKLSDHFTFVKY